MHRTELDSAPRRAHRPRLQLSTLLDASLWSGLLGLGFAVVAWSVQVG